VPKKVSQVELNSILEAVGRFPEGASVDEIATVLDMALPRRTLQRRLALLVNRNELVRQGRGRATRYRVPVVADKRTVVGQLRAGNAQLVGERYVEVSSQGEEIKRVVRAPIQQRTPVGYNRSFLDDYRPNESFYLPPEARQHLFDLGRSEQDARPAGTHAREIFNRLLIDLSWNSSRLEGNTYSLLETERLLQRGEAAEGKEAWEAQMILNHKRAIELLVDQAEEVAFNPYTIQNLHALLADNLLEDPQALGRLRTISVGIKGTVYEPLAVPQLIEECFRQILETASMIDDPFEQAFFVMVHLPYLQPFEDVNKRVSRLAANIGLIRGNLCPLSFVDVPERAYVDGLLGVYELNRVELLRDVFVWAYERSAARYSAVRRSLGEPDLFRMRYRESIAELIREVILAPLDRRAAGALIRRYANENIPEQDVAHFIELVEAEVMSLHEGNIARYRVRPSEFQVWRGIWDR
jgi:hypothetical protein